MVISARMPSVAVAYTRSGSRIVKQFGSNVAAARRFYNAKLNAGASPAVVKGDQL